MKKDKQYAVNDQYGRNVPKPPKDPKRRYAFHLTNYPETQLAVMRKHAAPKTEKLETHARYTPNGERVYMQSR